MADDLGRFPNRRVVLQVTAAEAGVADQPQAALLHELARQAEVRGVPRLPVQLDEGGLDDRVAIEIAVDRVLGRA